MPEPVTVWAVELARDAPLREERGTLSLGSDALEFRPRDEHRAPRRIALSDVVRAKRVRGSPVLVIVHQDGGRRTRTAFYFVQPPPIEPPTPTLPTTPFAFGRSGKRRARRQNVSYLGAGNRQKREEVRAWVEAVRVASGSGRAGDQAPPAPS